MRGRLGQPTNGGPMIRKSYDGHFFDRNGREIFEKSTMSTSVLFLAYRSFLNPVDYNGQIWQEIKDSYRTNELGFLISAMFFVTMA